MSREEIQKLLGGYATDTLNEAEKRALFEASLVDQELFDALAKEQALREVLQEPSARRQLLEALGPAPEPRASRAWQWLRRPEALILAGGLATLLIVAGVVSYRERLSARRELLMADVVKPKASPAPPPASAPPKVFATPLLTKKIERPAPLPAPPDLNEKREMAQTAPLPPAIALPAQSGPRASLIRREEAGTAKDATTERAIMLHDAQVRPTPPAPAAAKPTETAGRISQNEAHLPGARSSSLGMVRAKKVAPSASLAAPPAAGLGTRYGLLHKGADGDYAPADLDSIFQTGDSVRLWFDPNYSGYMYLFEREAGGGWRLAFSQHTEAGQHYILPDTGALQLNEPGRKELLVVLTPQEEPAGFKAAELDALASRARMSTMKGSIGGRDNRYAGMLPASGQQTVAFEIILESR